MDNFAEQRARGWSIVGAITGVAAIMCAFLPWVSMSVVLFSVSSYSVTGTEVIGVGVITAVAGVVVAIAGFANWNMRTPSIGGAIVALLGSMTILVAGILVWVGAVDASDVLNESGEGIYVRVESGLVGTVIAGAVGTVAPSGPWPDANASRRVHPSFREPPTR